MQFSSVFNCFFNTPNNSDKRLEITPIKSKILLYFVNISTHFAIFENISTNENNRKLKENMEYNLRLTEGWMLIWNKEYICSLTIYVIIMHH